MPIVVPSPPRDRGQATVEVVALLPILALIALAAGQAAVAGWTAWSAAGAARVGARAESLGGDPGRAARQVLPALLERHARVVVGAAGGADAGGSGSAGEAGAHRVTVRLRVPIVVPGLRAITVSGAAELPLQEAAS